MLSGILFPLNSRFFSLWTQDHCLLLLFPILLFLERIVQFSVFFCYVVHWFFLLVPKIQKKFIQLPFLSHNSPNVCLYDDVLVLQNHFEGFLSFFRWCSASEFPTGTLLIEKKKGKKNMKKSDTKNKQEKSIVRHRQSAVKRGGKRETKRQLGSWEACCN